MSDGDMHTRMSRLEWRQDALEDSHKRQEDRMTALSERIDVHHREVMEAIGSLKDERAKRVGAQEERERLSDKTLRRWRIAAIIAGIIGGAASLGWINTSEAAWIPVDAVADAPIYVQQYSRDVP